MKNKALMLLAVLCSLSVNAQDKTLETDWLDPEIGSTGQRLGAEITDIKTAPDSSTIIDFRLPLDNADQYQDIEVYDRSGKIPMKQVKPHKWMDDYEKGDYGLRIFLKRHPETGLRLRLIGSDDDKPGRK